MPLILDDERPMGGQGAMTTTGAMTQGAAAGSTAAAAGAQTGFDLQSCATLFWKPVPILLRHGEREEQQEELTFRILTGVSRTNHGMRVRATPCRALLPTPMRCCQPAS
jgi:hypothetical protein